MKFYPAVCNKCEHAFDLGCIEHPPKIFICPGCKACMVLSGVDNDSKISFYNELKTNWDAEN